MSRIYSRWKPDVGGYEYFESTERLGLGDDLAVPKLPRGTAIGVASTDIGRTAPGPLRPVGSGKAARGSILPISRAGLSGTFSVLIGLPVWVPLTLLGGLGLYVAWELRRNP